MLRSSTTISYGTASMAAPVFSIVSMSDTKLNLSCSKSDIASDMRIFRFAFDIGQCALTPKIRPTPRSGGRAWIAMLGTNLNGGTMEDRYFPHEFEVWQGDEMVASASGPREDALREAMHYAAQYAEDGPVRVFEVTRTLVPNL